MGAGDQKTILLVEDEAITAMAEKLALEKYGYQVLTANSGEEAVAAVEKTPAIDLVLMDINLGAGMDGTEAAAIILRQRDLPVVFLSSHMEQDIVAKTEKITFYGYVVKNSSITVLDASIKMAFKLFEAKTKEQEKESRMEAALAELRESEERHRDLVENSQDLICTHDLEGRLLSVNEAAARLTGYPLKELLGMNMADLLDPEIRRFFSAYLTRIKAAGKAHGLMRIRTASGEIRYWEYDNTLRTKGVAEPLVRGMAHDISERKRAEEEKERIISLQRATIESTADGILVIDQAGRITDFNRRFTQMWGIPDSVMAARDDAQTLRFVLDQLLDPQGFLTKVNELYAAPDQESFDLLQFKDGKYFERYSRPQLISGRAVGRVWSFRDISERKRAEDALRTSRQLIAGIINTIPVRVFWKDANLVYQGCNAAFALDAGFADPQNIIGKDDFQIRRRDQAELYRGDDRQVIESGRSKLLIEEPQTASEGHTITLLTNKIPLRNSRGEICGVIGTYMDISERKRAEEALRVAETRYRLLFEQSPDGIVIIDPVTARILEFNEASHRQLGYTREEFARLGIPDLEALETSEETRAHIARVMQEGRSDFETRQRTKHGEIRDIHVTAQFTQMLGRPIYHCIWRDITRRKQAEAEIKRQLEEKEILLREVHHRIKNNISSIGGLISLRAKSVSHPEALAVLQDAIGRVDSMRILYDKLLISEGYKDVAVKNYLDDLIDTIIAIFPDHAKIRLEKRIDDFHLHAKRLFPVGIIINELLTNIMKYALFDKKTGLIKVSLAKAGNQVTLTIQDNGKGLPDGFAIDKSKGFGLMLVKMLSQQLGGSFTMETHKGARCKVEFDM